jgi:dinuclear metal center YbgI/SA1388 family protein
MANRDEIIAYLDKYLEKPAFHDALPIGLLVEGRPEVRKVATGVSACLALFESAADWGADMIIVHHGMFWDKQDRVVRGPLKKRLKFLLNHDITLAGYHLPLDAHPEIGNNIVFARAMGFENPEPFGDYHGKCIGYKSGIPPISIEEFAEKAAAFYGTRPTAFLHGKPVISSAAVVSGGAHEFLPEAARTGLDCYVTGTRDEPIPHMAREWGIHFLAFGHYATERVGVRALADHLAREMKVEARFFDVDNPL